MSFRAKLLLACLPLALAPLAFFGLRARQEVTARLGAQDAERVAALADVIEKDLEREAASVAARLDRLAQTMAADNRLRLAVLDRDGADRPYLLDYAGQAMSLAGLDMLRIQDEQGRVLSSGHFRNEYDAVDPGLPAALARAGARGALVAAPTATGSILVLARAREARLGARTLTLTGGTAVDDRFLDRLARGTGLEVTLHAPAGSGPASARAGAGARAAPGPTGYTRDVNVRFAGPGADTIARFAVRASAGPLHALRRDMDRWLFAMLAITAGLALILTIVVSARLGRPLAELAGKAARVDLDRLDVAFPTGRADEVGALSRVLDRMTYRLRASAARLREAERRATIGEIARQVNHDVRNGLIPIRNVVRHLARLAREQPDELPSVFMERQATLESSVEYLHALAGNYARLSPSLDPQPCDLNAIVREVVADVGGGGPAAEVSVRAHTTEVASTAHPTETADDHRGAAERTGGASGRVRDEHAARVLTDLAPRLPTLRADRVALRRIVENLVVNALESLDGDGRVVVSTRVDRAGDQPHVRLDVVDTGRGMSAEERIRIFRDFYTTKPEGTGLGLSIVRRLVSDLDGRIAVESEPGRGTRFTVKLPAPGEASAAAAYRDPA